MSVYPPTIVIRHRKENVKKCTLQGLESRTDFLFFCYPLKHIPPYFNYILLTLDTTEELSQADQNRGLLLIDATWRYAYQMAQNIPHQERLVRRRLPGKIATAYPRRQEDCKDPSAGLASIEALYYAYHLMKRPVEGLLDHYYWKDSFLEKNKDVLYSRPLA